MSEQLAADSVRHDPQPAINAAMAMFLQPSVDVVQIIRSVVAQQQALNQEIDSLNRKISVTAAHPSPQQQKQMELYAQKLRNSKQRVESLTKMLIAIKGRLWRVHTVLQSKSRSLEKENEWLASPASQYTAPQPATPANNNSKGGEGKEPIEAVASSEVTVDGAVEGPPAEPQEDSTGVSSAPALPSNSDGGDEVDDQSTIRHQHQTQECDVADACSGTAKEIAQSANDCDEPNEAEQRPIEPDCPSETNAPHKSADDASTEVTSAQSDGVQHDQTQQEAPDSNEAVPKDAPSESHVDPLQPAKLSGNKAGKGGKGKKK